MAEPSVGEVFNSHLRESFDQILREAGDIEAADRYRQAKRAATPAVTKAKTWVWEKSREAMEEDYRSAMMKFWQTIQCLNTVYSGGGELLISTRDIVGWWKEYFEDLLKTPSIKEAEALYPPQGARGFMGVSPTSPHVICGLGPRPLWHSVGSASGVWGRRPYAKGCTVPVRPEQELGSHCQN